MGGTLRFSIIHWTKDCYPLKCRDVKLNASDGRRRIDFKPSPSTPWCFGQKNKVRRILSLVWRLWFKQDSKWWWKNHSIREGLKYTKTLIDGGRCIFWGWAPCKKKVHLGWEKKGCLEAFIQKVEINGNWFSQWKPESRWKWRDCKMGEQRRLDVPPTHRRSQ